MPIVNRVADLHADITAWRRDLHAHPELLYEVHRTAASVAARLTEFGCDEVVPETSSLTAAKEVTRSPTTKGRRSTSRGSKRMGLG